MRFLLIGILLGFPLLEAVVMVRLANTLGWWVLAWMILAACAGMALIKEARFAMLARLAAGLAHGEFPIVALTDSARTVIAGLLLIFPGVVSDLIAITLLLLPRSETVQQSKHPRASRPVIDAEFRRSR
jgi:UPF0716 protein FxsA